MLTSPTARLINSKIPKKEKNCKSHRGKKTPPGSSNENKPAIPSNNAVLNSVVPSACDLLISSLGFSPVLWIWVAQEGLPLLMRKALQDFVGLSLDFFHNYHQEDGCRNLCLATRNVRRLLPHWVLFFTKRSVILSSGIRLSYRF